MEQLHKFNFDYSNYLDEVLKMPQIKGEDMSRKGSAGFTGTNNFEEAEKMYRYGWDSGIEELKRELELEVQGTMDVSNGITGAFPNIGAYLSGNPECMVSFIDKTERKLDNITVFVQLNYRAGVTVDDALIYAKSILKYLVKLNKKYDIKLIGYFCSSFQGDNVEFVSVNIKDFNQNMVLNNLAFSFHPSFFRRIHFRFRETRSYLDYTYGRTKLFDYVTKFIKEHYLKDIQGKCISIPSLNDYGANWKEKDIVELK